MKYVPLYMYTNVDSGLLLKFAAVIICEVVKILTIFTFLQLNAYT